MTEKKRVRTISFISHGTSTDKSDKSSFKSLSINCPNSTKEKPCIVPKISPVHQWEIRFDISKNSDPYKFIDLVTEKKRAAKMTDKELLEVIPNILTGHALQWFQIYRKKFVTWQDFVVQFTQSYKNPKRLPVLYKMNKINYVKKGDPLQTFEMNATSESKMDKQDEVLRNFTKHCELKISDETSSTNLQNVNPNVCSTESNSKSVPKVSFEFNCNIKFDTSEHMDPYTFIDLVSKKKKLANITDDELLKAISDLLVGHALQWFKAHKNRFKTWQDFVVNFTQAYKDPLNVPPLRKKRKSHKKKSRNIQNDS